jgi:hypothetical protein
MTAAQHFSTEPSDARRLFLSACLDARIPATSFEAPRSNQSELPVQIDIAYVGQSTAPTVIVVCPGTRMAEGLCASGIQTTFLRTGLQIEMPDPIAMVLMHSVAPAAFEVAAWDSLIDQRAVETEWDDSLLAAAEVRFNEDCQQAKTMTLEESEHQKWCSQVLANVARRFLSRAQHLIFLDVHTGSGPYGEVEVVSCHTPGSQDEKRALELFGARAAVNSIATSHFQGPVARGLASFFPDLKTTSLVIEFGCYSLMTVLDSLLSRRETEAAGGGRFDRMFYPDVVDWRDLVWEGAEEILRLGFRSIDQTGVSAERPVEP